MKLALLFDLRPEALQGQEQTDLYSEFETIETIQAITLGLEAQGHTVVLVDAMKSPLESLRALRQSVDFVFNTSVGIGRRFRELMPAALCEALGIPYMGSDPMAMALTANKHAAKLFVRDLGIPTPAWTLFSRSSMKQNLPASETLVLKPVFEGSSIGVRGPLSRDTAHSLLGELAASYRQPYLVEQFIPGFEITVPVIGNPPRALSAMALYLGDEFYHSQRVFDWDTKATALGDIWRSSPPVSAEVLSEVRGLACQIHEALGCQDLSRTDFRVTRNSEIFFLEINATPQIAPRGCSFSASAREEGLDFEQLLSTLVSITAQRLRLA